MSGRGAWRPMNPKNITVRASVWIIGAIPFFTFSAMSIAGSATTTPGMENIFIGQIAKVGTDGSKIGGLRFGYMGLCAYVGVEGSNGDTFKNTNGFQCIGKQYDQSPDEIAATLHVDANIVQLGQKLQNDISIFMPMVALALFLLGFLVDTFAWLFAGLGKPVGKAGMIAMPFLWAAVATSLGAAYTLTVSVNAINTVLGDAAVGCSANVQIEQGKTLEGLQWAAFAFALLFAFGIYMVTRDTRCVLRRGAIIELREISIELMYEPLCKLKPRCHWHDEPPHVIRGIQARGVGVYEVYKYFCLGRCFDVMLFYFC